MLGEQHSVHSGNEMTPRTRTLSVCGYFSLSNERKVSELISLVDSATGFQRQPNWSYPCKVQTQDGYLLPRGSLGSKTSESVTCQQAWKGKNQCNTRGSGGSHTAQDTPPPTFWNGGIYPTTCGLIWNVNRMPVSRGTKWRQCLQQPPVFTCFVLIHLVNKHFRAPSMYL